MDSFEADDLWDALNVSDCIVNKLLRGEVVSKSECAKKRSLVRNFIIGICCKTTKDCELKQLFEHILNALKSFLSDIEGKDDMTDTDDAVSLIVDKWKSYDMLRRHFTFIFSSFTESFVHSKCCLLCFCNLLFECHQLCGHH